MPRRMLGCVKKGRMAKIHQVKQRANWGKHCQVSDIEKELISLIYNDLLQLNKKTNNLNEKSSDSTSRQFREKGTPVATKHREIVSLSCKKRNSNANSNDIPFSKITLPKIRILMAQYVDRSARNRLPFKLLLEGVSVGTTSSSLERLITIEMPVHLKAALPIPPACAKDACA